VLEVAQDRPSMPGAMALTEQQTMRVAAVVAAATITPHRLLASQAEMVAYTAVAVLVVWGPAQLVRPQTAAMVLLVLLS